MRSFRSYSLWVLTLIVGVVFAACRPVEQKTELVRRVESQGAGDLRVTSSAAMKPWFANHPKVIAEVLPECQRIQKTATATWRDSTEGRMCQAAAAASAFGNPNVYPVN